MLKGKKLLALILAIVMAISCVPVAMAAQSQEAHGHGGWVNPAFEGRVTAARPLMQAPLYYGSASNVTYITDAAEASALIREGLESREAVIPLHFIIPEILPSDQSTMEERLSEIVRDLWEDAFIETDQPTRAIPCNIAGAL